MAFATTIARSYQWQRRTPRRDSIFWAECNLLGAIGTDVDYGRQRLRTGTTRGELSAVFAADLQNARQWWCVCSYRNARESSESIVAQNAKIVATNSSGKQVLKAGIR